jgi:hypothetical protein
MLRRGDQYAFLHQAGGVAYPGHISGLGFNSESLQISAPEQDAGVGRRGAKTQAHPDAGVQADPGDRNRSHDRTLVGQNVHHKDYKSTCLTISTDLCYAHYYQ